MLAILCKSLAEGCDVEVGAAEFRAALGFRSEPVARGLLFEAKLEPFLVEGLATPKDRNLSHAEQKLKGH